MYVSNFCTPKAPSQSQIEAGTYNDLPDQNLAETPRALAIYELFCATELYIHIRIDADQAAFIFGLAPL
jgi:hypothetical protein